MCGCDSIISLLCLGVPAIAYAVVFGFLPRNATKLQNALTKCLGGSPKDFGNCMIKENEVSKTWFIIVLLALVAILLAIAVLIIKCVLCCCAACCPCICCCFDYLFGIAIGLAIPTVVDAGLYLFCAIKIGSMVQGSGQTPSRFLMILCTYSGYGALSLGSAWLLSLILVFFLGNKGCGLRSLILILGSIVAFTVITVLVVTNSMLLRDSSAPKLDSFQKKLPGLFLGALEVVAYLGAFFIAKPCFCCGK